MNFQHILIILTILLGVTLISKGTIEFFQSPGTIVQLLAKGPQDSYLTGWPYGHAGAYYWPWYGDQYYGDQYYGDQYYGEYLW